MLAPMAGVAKRSAWAALVGGVALLAASCEAEVWLAAAGVRAFRQVSLAEARELLEDPGARLVVAGRRPAGLGWAPSVEGDAPLPEPLLERGGPLLVVAEDGRDGRRLSARLVRAGARCVTLLVAEAAELRTLRGPVLARPGPV
jgi:hypothetical protein